MHRPVKKEKKRGAWTGLFIPTDAEEDGEERLNDDEGRLLIKTEDSKCDTYMHVLGDKKLPDEDSDG